MPVGHDDGARLLLSLLHRIAIPSGPLFAAGDVVGGHFSRLFQPHLHNRLFSVLSTRHAEKRAILGAKIVADFAFNHIGHSNHGPSTAAATIIRVYFFRIYIYFLWSLRNLKKVVNQVSIKTIVFGKLVIFLNNNYKDGKQSLKKSRTSRFNSIFYKFW